MDIVQVFSEHIHRQFCAYKSTFDGDAVVGPFFVAMQGPQGSGKTTICASLTQLLAKDPFRLNVVAMSIDDLYHTHENLVEIARASNGCTLLSGRGQPGTHDLALGRHILDSLQKVNHTHGQVDLPVFDKSLFQGEGDRATRRVTVTHPVDVFILEGWSMGFRNLSEDKIRQIRLSAPEGSPLRQHSLQHLLLINDKLKDYVTQWYCRFHLLLQVKTDQLDAIYRWRLQQEHALRQANDGVGMTDDQVKRFVDRYMPGYLLFLSTVTDNSHWRGKSLTVHIDEHRRLLRAVHW